MSDTDSTLRFVPDLETRTVRRIVGVALALAGLLVLLGLATVLPGLDRLLEALAVSPVALVVALATLVTVLALIWVAPSVESAVEQLLDGPDAPVTNTAASAKLLVCFAAVVVAYRGFAPAVTPLFEAFGIAGLYHLAFLVLGVLTLGAFAGRLYRCWEPVTALLTDHLVDVLGDDEEQVGVTDRPSS